MGTATALPPQWRDLANRELRRPGPTGAIRRGTLAYDGAGDLVSATDGAQVTSITTISSATCAGSRCRRHTITYVVDAYDRRVGKNVNGTLVKAFLYANQLLPVAELDGAGE